MSQQMQTQYHESYYANENAYYKANMPNNYIGYQNYTEQGYDPQTSNTEYALDSDYNYAK